jgi:hypothetical protein
MHLDPFRFTVERHPLHGTLIRPVDGGRADPLLQCAVLAQRLVVRGESPLESVEALQRASHGQKIRGVRQAIASPPAGDDGATSFPEQTMC